MSAGDRLSPEIGRVAIVVVIGAVMSIIDTSIVNVALESLSRDRDAPLSTIQWVASGYLLAAHTFWWAMAIAAVALVPALVLACVQRAARRTEAAGAPAPVASVG